MSRFQSLSRDSGRLNDNIVRPVSRPSLQFQSLSRDSGRLNVAEKRDLVSRQMFQSLSRDSGRLNPSVRDAVSYALPVVSIPQSGFGAFEPKCLDRRLSCPPSVSIPQSGFGAFERSNRNDASV